MHCSSLFLKIFIAFSLLHLAFSSPAIYGIDGNALLSVSMSLAKNSDVSVTCDSGSKLGRNGNCYSKYYPLLSFISVPVVFFGLKISQYFNLNERYICAALVLFLQSFISAATASLLFLISLNLNKSKSLAVFVSFSYAICTYAFVYSRTFFADPLVALLGTCSIYFGIIRANENRNYYLSSLFSCLAVLAKPTAIVFGPALSLYYLFEKEKFHRIIIPLFGTIMGLLVYGGYNYLRFNNILDFGQPSDFNIQNIHKNILGNIISPGRGIIYYSPLIILSFYEILVNFNKLKHEILIILFILIYYLVLHSFWQHWHGGSSWGPRLLLPVVPLLYMFIVLESERIRKIAIILSTLGFIVSFPNLYSYYGRYNAELVDKNMNAEWDYVWSFSNSLLTNIWGSSHRQLKDSMNTDVVDIVNNAGEASSTVSESQILKIIPIWWWMLPVMGISIYVGIFGAFIMISSALYILYSTYRE